MGSLLPVVGDVVFGSRKEEEASGGEGVPGDGVVGVRCVYTVHTV